eukprot:8805185-Alexandrium_andersonii.AAC.2
MARHPEGGLPPRHSATGRWPALRRTSSRDDLADFLTPSAKGPSTRVQMHGGLGHKTALGGFAPAPLKGASTDLHPEALGRPSAKRPSPTRLSEGPPGAEHAGESAR